MEEKPNPKIKSPLRSIVEKVLWGAVLYLFLIFFGPVCALSVVGLMDIPGEVQGYQKLLIGWVVVTALLLLINNAVCRKWFAFDKLRTCQYSWKQFAVIFVLLPLGMGGIPTYPSSKAYVISLFLMDVFVFLIFLGYLTFFLADRYVKKRTLKMAVKSTAFVIFILLSFFVSLIGN
jgi:hypothetical protein